MRGLFLLLALLATPHTTEVSTRTLHAVTHSLTRTLDTTRNALRSTISVSS